MRLRPASVSAALLCVVLSACPHRVPNAIERLDSALKEARAPDARPRALALAGFHAFLVEGAMAQAAERFNAAVAKNPSEPFGLYGQVLLARRQAHPEVALAAALDLCERAPGHPLAVAAARVVLDLAGAAVPLDELILQRSERALAQGLAGDGAQLLRSAQASILAQR